VSRRRKQVVAVVAGEQCCEQGNTKGLKQGIVRSTMLLERHGHSVSIQCILELGAPDFAVRNLKPTFAMR